MAEPAPDTMLLTYAEAERIGEQLHDFVQHYGVTPMPACHLAWADAVQLVLRKAGEAVRARPDVTEVPTVQDEGGQ